MSLVITSRLYGAGISHHFESELDSVALKPSEVNGNFHISVMVKKYLIAKNLAASLK
jgi:hypothetical protein